MRLTGERAVRLRGGPYTATVAPAAGSRLMSLQWLGDGHSQDLLVPWDGQAFNSHDWPKAGLFPMAPFANRLPPQGLRFGGRIVRLPSGPAGYPLHGWVHRMSWDVVDVNASAVTLQVVHRAGERSDWPWAFTCIQRIALNDQGCHIDLTLRNESAQAMPGGLGLHPYHPLPRQALPGDLHFHAMIRHDLDAQGRAGPAATPGQFGLQRAETAAFSGWPGALRLQGPSGSISVRVRGTERMVLHRPAQGAYLCVEPVTALPGWLDGADVSGEMAIAAGESRTLSWTCQFDPQRR